MVNKNVIISVNGRQSFGSDEMNSIELITEGKYYKKDEAYYIIYKESEITGMEGTTTTLKIVDGKVTLMRFGMTNSQFIFERGQKHVSYYDTYYGAFTVGIYTHDVWINVDENGGEVRVDYMVEIDSHPTGANDFHMFIREAGRTNDTQYGAKS